MDTLPDLLEGRVKAVPQNDAEAVYSPNITREQERIDWSKPAVDIWNLVRALHPRPGAFTLWNGEVLKVWRCAKPEPGGAAKPGTVPGTIVGFGEQGLEVAAGEGVLCITELQPAGKKAMAAAEWVRGGQVSVGTVLGESGSPDGGSV
ncbi:hypothetical protein LJK87_16390 [Paenibacillus sp. P25]|nr:hypothetical protein LJK87_16390 [Paenibacillus sp. P25]